MVDEPLPEFWDAIQRVVVPVRRDEHVGVEQVQQPSPLHFAHSGRIGVATHERVDV